MVDIFGLAGILAPRNETGFFREYTRIMDRFPPTNNSDWEYPVSWWRGSDGVDEEAVAFWFGEVLA